MKPTEDPLLDALSQLPAHDVDALTAEKIRRRARAALAEEAARPAWARTASRWWTAVEPALAAAVVLLYAGWALSTSAALVSPGHDGARGALPKLSAAGALAERSPAADPIRTASPRAGWAPSAGSPPPGG